MDKDGLRVPGTAYRLQIDSAWIGSTGIVRQINQKLLATST